VRPSQGSAARSRKQSRSRRRPRCGDCRSRTKAAARAPAPMRTARAIPIVRHGAKRTGPVRSPRRQSDCAALRWQDDESSRPGSTSERASRPKAGLTRAVQNRLNDYAAAPVADGPASPARWHLGERKSTPAPASSGMSCEWPSPQCAAGRSTSRLVVYGRRGCDGAAANLLIPR
jgi:hypothetical protein